MGGAVLLVSALLAVVGAGRATASFGGGNGALDFAADRGDGQQVWSVFELVN